MLRLGPWLRTSHRTVPGVMTWLQSGPVKPSVHTQLPRVCWWQISEWVSGTMHQIAKFAFDRDGSILFWFHLGWRVGNTQLLHGVLGSISGSARRSERGMLVELLWGGRRKLRVPFFWGKVKRKECLWYCLGRGERYLCHLSWCFEGVGRKKGIVRLLFRWRFRNVYGAALRE